VSFSSFIVDGADGSGLLRGGMLRVLPVYATGYNDGGAGGDALYQRGSHIVQGLLAAAQRAGREDRGAGRTAATRWTPPAKCWPLRSGGSTDYYPQIAGTCDVK
jgi:hypothetical protein